MHNQRKKIFQRKKRNHNRFPKFKVWLKWGMNNKWLETLYQQSIK